MELNTTPRAAQRKSDAKKLRREGKIPAILYKRGSDSHPIAVERREYEAALRQIKERHLPTTRFTLVGEWGKKEAIVKGVQYDPTSYDVLHLDFEELEKGVSIRVNVPIVFSGVAECVGVKQGGSLRQIIDYLRVECTPDTLPLHYVLDVQSLEMNQGAKLNSIDLQGVRPLVSLEEIAVIVAKR